MKYFAQKKRMVSLVLLTTVLLAGCSREAEPTPQATQTAFPPPFEVTYCDINPADMCLEGFGLDIDSNLLILFRADKPLYADIYIRAVGPESEILFECQHSAEFPENVYCLGEPFQEADLIKLNIYSKSSNKFIAIGVFNVQFSNLPEPDVAFGVEATPTASPDPSYPNPSYPNPTSAP